MGYVLSSFELSSTQKSSSFSRYACITFFIYRQFALEDSLEI